MAQQQAKTYQYDLFSETGQEVDRPYDKSEAVRGAQPAKALKVGKAGYWPSPVKDTGASQDAHKPTRLSTTNGLMQ